MPVPAVDSLAPDRFILWSPPPGMSLTVGADGRQVSLAEFPLPLDLQHANQPIPDDAAIGQGLYDYLRRFPDCPGNVYYAHLLRDAFPHFLADLAALAVMLDAKQVEPAYVARKLTCLKILQLVEPANRGLLWQLSRGYFALALEFVELARCRQHLHQALRYAQDLQALDATDPQALSLLAEIDLLMGDFPAAVAKWRRLAAQIGDPDQQARIAERIKVCDRGEAPPWPLIEELEMIASAMQLHAQGDDAQAVDLLDRIEDRGQLPALFPSADFYCLLGLCRQTAGNPGGAALALHKALELEPDHAASLSALDNL